GRAWPAPRRYPSRERTGAGAGVKRARTPRATPSFDASSCSRSKDGAAITRLDETSQHDAVKGAKNPRDGGRRGGDRRVAPRVGFEPTTLRLTAECSTIELPRNETEAGGRQDPASGGRRDYPGGRSPVKRAPGMELAARHGGFFGIQPLRLKPRRSALSR